MSICSWRRAEPQLAESVARVPAYSSSARIASIWIAFASNSTASAATRTAQIARRSRRIASEEPSPLRSRSRSRVGAVRLIGPEAQQHGAFEHESFAGNRDPQPVQESLEAEAGEQSLVLAACLPCAAEQTRGNRGGQIDLLLGHAIESRYGCMTRVTRQMRAKRAKAVAPPRCRRLKSRSASTATSRPILLRYLKQSATVFAAE